MANAPKLFGYQFESKEEYKAVLKSMWNTGYTFLQPTPQTQQSKQFALSLLPGLKVWYNNDNEKIIPIMVEHSEIYFNSHTVGFSLVAGIVLAMEKERTKNSEVTSKAIQGVKAALMGPTAGIGDSLYASCLRVILGSIAISLALQTYNVTGNIADGNPLGAIFFITTFGGITLASKYLFFLLGFCKGVDIVDKAFKSGLVPLLSKAAAIVGLVITGSLIASNVKINIAYAPEINGSVVNFQTILDNIAPGILSLALWYWTFKRLQKGWKPVTLIWVIMAVCVALKFLGIL